MKIKIFSGECASLVETNVNDFLRTLNALTLIGIRYLQSSSGTETRHYNQLTVIVEYSDVKTK